MADLWLTLLIAVHLGQPTEVVVLQHDSPPQRVEITLKAWCDNMVVDVTYAPGRNMTAGQDAQILSIMQGELNIGSNVLNRVNAIIGDAKEIRTINIRNCQYTDGIREMDLSVVYQTETDETQLPVFRFVDGELLRVQF